jgi:hypothetical protein
VVQPRPCAVCSVFFVPRLSMGIACGGPCSRRLGDINQRWKAVRDPEYRSRRLQQRRKANAKSRERPWVEQYDCVGCGRRCIRGENVPIRANRWCSKSCAKNHLRSASPTPTKIQRKRAELARRDRGLASRRRRTWQQSTCGECGSRFLVPARATDATCSRVCADGWRRSQVKDGRRRRRARQRGASRRERYSLRQIAERDRWKCQLCGDLVLKSAAVPHPRAPTVDHILPLARGGDDTVANVQLACFRCNCLKGDRVLKPEQLRLVG